MASRHRPRRGEPGPDVLVEGDEGIFGGYQGGAKPGATESGDLAAREFGVPQADLPGGVVHLVNPEAKVTETADKGTRPSDYHKYHGVPSDDGRYRLPPDLLDVTRPPRPEPEPKVSEAVPVYIVEGGGAERKIRTLPTIGPLTLKTAAFPLDPQRILERDPYRVECLFSVELGAVRVGSLEDVAIGRGLVLQSTATAAVTFTLKTQDDLWAAAAFGANATISWGNITEVPASGA